MAHVTDKTIDTLGGYYTNALGRSGIRILRILKSCELVSFTYLNFVTAEMSSSF